jgi:hypothetical protein
VARTAHAIVKAGVDYRPFFGGGGARREDPSLLEPSGRSRSRR